MTDTTTAAAKRLDSWRKIDEWRRTEEGKEQRNATRRKFDRHV